MNCIPRLVKVPTLCKSLNTTQCVSWVVVCLLTAFSLEAVSNEVSVQYEYDELNRLTRMSDSCGNVRTYTYDPSGNMTNRSASRTSGTFEGCDDQTVVASLAVPSNQWTLVGLPSNAEQSTVADVFGSVLELDDLARTWIMFEYDPANSDSGYRTMEPSDIMNAGTGYWFIQISGSAVELQVPASGNPQIANAQGGECIDGNACLVADFPQPVRAAESWSVLANPYPTAQSVSSVFIGLVSGSEITTTSLDQQQPEIFHTAGLFVYRYSGDPPSYQLIDSTGTLQPWEAGWLGVVPNANPVSRLYAGFTVQ